MVSSNARVLWHLKRSSIAFHIFCLATLLRIVASVSYTELIQVSVAVAHLL